MTATPTSSPISSRGRIAASRRRRIAPWLVVAAWFAGCAYAAWRFDLGLQRPFETARTALFDSSARQAAAERWFRSAIGPLAPRPAPLATVVHVYRGGCACNRFTDPHLARIVARYRARNIEFVAAEAHQQAMAVQPVPAGLRRLALSGAGLAWLDATPAALVFDSAGHLIYYGPYSDGARCGEGGGLIERVLDHVLDGHTPLPQPHFAAGCFCGTSRT